MKLDKLLLATLLAVTLAGCATKPSESLEKDPLTHGNVQLTLKKGQTSKTDVLEAFGAPNITSTDASGREVWTYQRAATVSESSSSSSYATIILLGGGKSASGFEQSSRTMTLIIKFNAEGLVDDFKSRASSF